MFGAAAMKPALVAAGALAGFFGLGYIASRGRPASSAGLGEELQYEPSTGRYVRAGARELAADSSRLLSDAERKAQGGLARAEGAVESGLNKAESAAERLRREAREGVYEAERVGDRLVDKTRRGIDRAEASVERGLSRAEAEALRLKDEAEAEAKRTGGFFKRMLTFGSAGAPEPKDVRAARGGGDVIYVEDELLDEKALAIKRRADEEAVKAQGYQATAQQKAAEAAAAEAAAALLKKKEEQAAQDAQRQLDAARSLEEEAARRRQEAHELSRLAKKEHRYYEDAERDAERKLKEQEKAMKESARYAEMSLKDQQLAEAERLRLIKARDEAALARARAAEEEARRDRELYQREAEEAALAKRRVEQLRREAADKAAEMSAAEARIREAAQKENEARAAWEKARELAAAAALEKGAAEKRALDVRKGAEGFLSRTSLLEEEARRHEAAANAARQALANAEAERLAAEKAHQQAQTLGSRISGWFAGRQPTAVVASSDATGAAAAQDVRDPSRAKGTEKGTAVTASGQASVTLTPTIEPVEGGRARAQIDLAAGKDTAKSRIGMTESSRSAGRPSLPTDQIE